MTLFIDEVLTLKSLCEKRITAIVAAPEHGHEPVIRLAAASLRRESTTLVLLPAHHVGRDPGWR